ncbi:MAG: SCO family protein [Deltaproteobacteria bacterium]|nr:SCO family protein [Deltaproteobacteria bacterium]
MNLRPKEVVIGIVVAGAFLFGEQNRAISGEPHPHSVTRTASRRQLHLPIPDFSLTDQTGKPFKFQTLRGKLVPVAFVYTTCPDVCPLMTASMRLVQEKLPDRQRHSVFLLSITTDPEVDSPRVLKAYGERYGIDFSNWLFLTAELQTLAPVWKAFGVGVQRKARGLVDHTPLTALIDAKGNMRFAYIGGSPDHKMILRDIDFLLGSR